MAARWHLREQEVELDQKPYLKGRLSIATAASNGLPRTLAVILHPYAPLGGSMSDHVVQGLAHALTHDSFLDRSEAGIAVLRYNARGVEVGKTSWKGQAEIGDLELWIQWSFDKLHWRSSQEKHKLFIIGYSYGSLAASAFRLKESDGIRAEVHYALISYPLSVLGPLTAFHTGPFKSAIKTIPFDSALCLVYANHDNFTSLSQYQKWSMAARQGRPERLFQEHVLDDNHFWISSRRRLTEVLIHWIASQ